MTLSSYRYRRRSAILVAAGVLALLPVLATGSYGAGTITVTFRGTPTPAGQTACPSTPDIAYLRVTPGTTVNFADELGVPATLWADDVHKHLRNNEMVPVTFTTGPSEIHLQMLPDCQLDLGTHGKVTVEVSSGPSSAPARPRASRPSPGRPSPTAGGAVGAGSGDDDPNGPGASVPDAAASVSLGAPVVSAPAPHGASGLLTLVATVCVVGVAAAALRAVVAQRAMLVERTIIAQRATRTFPH